ncbi:MAG: DoxX family protein [Lysobacterales bacterium CG02_land_8_20_14_3_00_62_12]|nr:MAG: DoxX family protein [Xanthomonadales bacterium CG02_land_8_20_14_3_00_62_12]PJA41685.1 MAG: DoxX family protein [Xanthomonadales bacterium CG_4_9_14_3_um_filter_62_6]
MNQLINLWQVLIARLRGVGDAVPNLAIRLILGWEFMESGLEKYHGENWFADVQSNFPFPFSAVPPELSWQIATWFEILGGAFLWLGLATRFWAFSLLILDFVAIKAVHWEVFSGWSNLLKGYVITPDGFGNFKLPLLFAILLLPLIFNGPGRISLDYLAARWFKSAIYPEPELGLNAWALASLMIGACALMLVPMIGAALVALAVVLAAAGRWLRA